jgi:GNAT superfamily N-acetyltransferase
MIELQPTQHARLRPLFTNFGARVHGCVEAVFSGEFGRAWADDADAPTVALAHIDFWLIGGDANAPAAADALRRIPQRGTIVTSGGMWDERVRSTLSGDMHERTRTGMATPMSTAWNRDRLQAMASAIPDGFEIQRVTESDVQAFASFEKDLVANFGTIERYLESGIGFGVWHDGHWVAGCSSFTLAGGKLEMEIDTHPDFRRRGLARSVAATMILHCLDEGIEPCWDAHNPESAALALQLGFVDPQPYTVFVVGTDRVGPP